MLVPGIRFCSDPQHFQRKNAHFHAQSKTLVGEIQYQMSEDVPECQSRRLLSQRSSIYSNLANMRSSIVNTNPEIEICEGGSILYGKLVVVSNIITHEEHQRLVQENSESDHVFCYLHCRACVRLEWRRNQVTRKGPARSGNVKVGISADLV
jgi:hypothetical protein